MNSGDGECWMRIIELHRKLPRGMRRGCRRDVELHPDHVLQRAGDEEELLL
jgi:hypothetical protein